MPARQHETDAEKFVPRSKVEPLLLDIDTSDLLMRAPAIVKKATKNAIVSKHGINWKEYRPQVVDGVAYIIRETCERCGKVSLAPGQRKLRLLNTDIGPVYMDTGICKDCINASIYVDKFLDGDPLGEVEAKKLFYKYAEAYEKQWRITLAVAPRIAMTNDEWQHRCKFFGGCALCGGFIEVQHKYFPAELNGIYTAWNIIPLCGECANKYKRVGRRPDPTKAPALYRVFSSPTYFQKTKTIRLFLLAQMEYHGIYMDNLTEYRQRFFEKKILEGSMPILNIDTRFAAQVISLSRCSALSFEDIMDTIHEAQAAGISDAEIENNLGSQDALQSLRILAKSMLLIGKETIND